MLSLSHSPSLSISPSLFISPSLSISPPLSVYLFISASCGSAWLRGDCFVDMMLKLRKVSGSFCPQYHFSVSFGRSAELLLVRWAFVDWASALYSMSNTRTDGHTVPFWKQNNWISTTRPLSVVSQTYWTSLLPRTHLPGWWGGVVGRYVANRLLKLPSATNSQIPNSIQIQYKFNTKCIPVTESSRPKDLFSVAIPLWILHIMILFCSSVLMVH